MRVGRRVAKKTAGGDGDGDVGPRLRFEVSGPQGDRTLTVKLAKGESVLADGGTLAYCDGEVAVTTAAGSLKRLFGRALAGESAFQNTYTGTSDMGDQAVTFAAVVPGDIVELRLAPGEALKLTRGAFLAGTPNVEVTGTLNMRGLLGVGQQEGVVISLVKAPADRGAVVLATGFGSVTRHEVAAGRSLVVNNERFFACDSRVSYTISKMGNVKSFLFGGEGFVMRFTGPCVVWTQSHGVAQFATALAEYMPSKDDGGLRISLFGGKATAKKGTPRRRA